MKSIVFDRFGEPGEVLECREVPEPEPGPGQVRVRMIASPINPSDLLVVRGQYGKLPVLPATPGFEGVGVVEAAGPGWIGWLRRGLRVAVLSGAGGTWSEQVVVPSRQVIPVPRALGDDQAASFFVNPATALVMVRRVLRVPRGAWLAQTAAGSALGRMIIRLGRHDGFRTINIVRRRETAEELARLGADAVVCTADEPLAERVKAITGPDGLRYAVDAVGGETGSSLVGVMTGGRVLVYGTLSGQPLRIDPRDLMVANAAVEGFWLSNWVRTQGVLSMIGLLREVGKLQVAGVLAGDAGKSFPPEEIKAAVAHAQEPGRQGKTLLRLGNRAG